MGEAAEALDDDGSNVLFVRLTQEQNFRDDVSLGEFAMSLCVELRGGAGNSLPREGPLGGDLFVPYRRTTLRYRIVFS